MSEACYFGTHLPASSVEVGLVSMCTLVAMTLGILDSALLALGKCCLLELDDGKTFEYTPICLQTEWSGFPPLFSIVKKSMLDTFAKL